MTASSAPMASASFMVSLILRLPSATVEGDDLAARGVAHLQAASRAFFSRSPTLYGIASNTGSRSLMRTICRSGFVFTHTTMSIAHHLPVAGFDTVRRAVLGPGRSLV